MEWYWFIVISVIVFSLATLYQRTILENSRDPVVYYIVNAFFGSLILLSWGLFLGFKVPDLHNYSLNLIIMTVFLGAGNVFSFNALKKTEASEFTVLFSTRALWSIVVAVLVLGESFNLKQIIGAALIMASVFLVSWKKKSFRLNEGETLTLVAAFFFGVEFINDSYLVSRLDLFFYLPLVFFLPAIFISAINYKKLLKIHRVLGIKDTLKLAFLALMFSIAVTSTFTAYEKGHNAAQIAILNQTSTILIVVLSIIFLKERNHLYLKILGGVISLIGVFLVR